MKLPKILLISGIMLGVILQSSAQVVDLPAVEIEAVNYKYLNSVSGEQEAGPVVSMLERQAAAFDVTTSEFYEDEYNSYFVTFYIPEGKILASYDKEGKLLRTAEKFKNVALPRDVGQAVAKRFPQWALGKDVYLVNYHDARGVNKLYKLTLENGNKRMKVKLNEKGEFL